MIAQSNGEVSFKDGLCISSFSPIQSVSALAGATSHVKPRNLPIQGWRQFDLGTHTTDYGTFAVEVAVGSEERVGAVFLSHCHSFYTQSTRGDSERRTFHDGIIATELRGQREFSWGSVFCKYDPVKNRDWLVVVFNPFSNVPKIAARKDVILRAHEIPDEIAEPDDEPNAAPPRRLT